MTAGFFVRIVIAYLPVMAGRVPAIHVLLCRGEERRDARTKRGHDEDGFTAGCPLLLRGALATKQSSLGLGYLVARFALVFLIVKYAPRKLMRATTMATASNT
jgi:hypothetical protein